MITIPMQVETDGIVVPMQVGTDSQTIGLSIGAEYKVAEGESYTGPYEVTPKAWEVQTLATKDKLMAEDLTVFKVPYYETSNLYDGLTVFIAEDTNG